MDDQVARFVEVIKKIHINVPLVDAMQVPTYANNLKDILSNKRPMPTTEVIKLDEDINDIRIMMTEDGVPNQAVTSPPLVVAPPRVMDPSSNETTTYKGPITRARAQELKTVLMLMNDGPG
ncbi:hypothetical protein PR202_ga24342 [Eleusine coracana subsp. coracana]|uniref:Reverse transcriptase domain-containing protein n=1 Tax=Eleusine coracana subsp. coracana TaxID=191504 RepID=A0AAV5D905_ELECO|nr:hypothetical protein PR202_ga24342 [Eleusine coracana subsp. coracana]